FHKTHSELDPKDSTTTAKACCTSFLFRLTRVRTLLSTISTSLLELSSSRCAASIMRCNSSSDKFIISSISAPMALLLPLTMAFATDDVLVDEDVPIGSAPLVIAQVLDRAVSASREEKAFGG